MLYNPDQVAADDLDIAQSPFFGGEFLIYITQKPAVLAYELEVLTVDDAIAQAMLVTATPGVTLDAAGVDLQTGLRGPLQSDVAAVLTLLGKNSVDANTFLSATYAPPARSANQSFNFERGIAFDLNPENGIAKSIQSATIVGGKVGAIFGVYRLPELADYTFIGCTRDVEFNTRSRTAKGVDCGMESDAFVKRGKTQPGELSIGGKLKGFADGLARFDGMKCTCMMVGLKDGRVMTDRLVFTQFVPTIKPKLPEGDGEAMIDATGKFVDHLFFVAGDVPPGDVLIDSGADTMTDSGGDTLVI